MQITTSNYISQYNKNIEHYLSGLHRTKYALSQTVAIKR